MGNNTNKLEKLRIISENDPYSILGVTEDADMEEITQMFKYYAKQYHPDRMSGLKGTEEYRETESIFKKISKAYNLLKDPNERKRYDLESRLKRAQHYADVQKEALQSETAGDSGPPKPVVNPQIVKKQSKNFKLDNNMKSFTLSQFKVAEIDQGKLEELRLEREKKDQGEAKLNFEKAKEFFSKENYDEAINLLRKIIEKFPKSPEYHSYLGLVMQKKGWESYAQAEFKVALKYNPNDKIALENFRGEKIKPKEKKGFFDKFFKRS